MFNGLEDDYYYFDCGEENPSRLNLFGKNGKALNRGPSSKNPSGIQTSSIAFD